MKISIIMPAYNAEKTIVQAVDSVLGQSFGDWELIIVDDNSTDGTIAAIPADLRIKVIKSAVNQGAAAARNLAVSCATGDWLAFLDSDDLWHSQKLQRQVEFIAKTNAKICYTATSYITETNQPYNYILHAKNTLTYKELLKRNLMSCSSVMVQKSLMLPFPIGNLHEDYAVWLKILRTEKYAHGLDEPLLIYRMVKGSKSDSRVASGIMTYNAYRYVGYNSIAAAFLTLRYAVHSLTKRLFIKRLNFNG
ncbi:MAG: glycosyltransferase [Defluviitaleaceae bacterium]|nr:glycosyltransferase [Defluviitaleaceae bacterium]